MGVACGEPVKAIGGEPGGEMKVLEETGGS